eukprot:NODE_744_length_773_cov_11.755385_g736_i0.p2 GENE.NODE_744_length_773_cov_11.755385_g736_i0~~NODE_744_length_773_cov_11.755385_g736_i0.p2  ORF type:complete len:137 (+),score=10.97 NODE_744_length_773_cov_11.755385_g736_i0:236-646(+)
MTVTTVVPAMPQIPVNQIRFLVQDLGLLINLPTEPVFAWGIKFGLTVTLTSHPREQPFPFLGRSDVVTLEANDLKGSLEVPVDPETGIATFKDLSFKGAGEENRIIVASSPAVRISTRKFVRVTGDAKVFFHQQSR